MTIHLDPVRRSVATMGAALLTVFIVIASVPHFPVA